MPFAVKSCLDVAFWFSDRALNDREYLQPQKLHRLMFLAQAYYPVAYPGTKLMPATFITDNLGPVEPTVFHALAYGRPHTIEANPIDDPIVQFLDGIWRRFGQYNADQLTKKLNEHPPVVRALAKGRGTEISVDEMIRYYAEEAAASRGALAAKKLLPPRVLRSHDGRAVAVSAWKPKALDG